MLCNLSKSFRYDTRVLKGRSHLFHLGPYISPLQPPRRRLVEKWLSHDSDKTDIDIGVQPEALSKVPSPLLKEWSLLTTAATLAQSWAVLLPLGNGVLPLFAKSLESISGGKAFAAFIVETAGLVAVRTILCRRGWSSVLKFDFSEAEAVMNGVFIGIATLLCCQFLFGNGKGMTDDNSELVSILNGPGIVGPALLFVTSTVLAPATEEMLYRGFLIQALKLEQVNSYISIATSSLLFAVAHLEPSAIPELFIVGYTLGWAVHCSGGNLAASFVAHALYNGTLLLSLSLSTN